MGHGLGSADTPSHPRPTCSSPPAFFVGLLLAEQLLKSNFFSARSIFHPIHFSLAPHPPSPLPLVPFPSPPPFLFAGRLGGRTRAERPQPPLRMVALPATFSPLACPPHAAAHMARNVHSGRFLVITRCGRQTGEFVSPKERPPAPLAPPLPLAHPSLACLALAAAHLARDVLYTVVVFSYSLDVAAVPASPSPFRLLTQPATHPPSHPPETNLHTST